jgi:hypothetical protein
MKNNQDLKPYKFEFKPNAISFRKILSEPRFEPQYLGQTTGALVYFALPLLFKALSIIKILT